MYNMYFHSPIYLNSISILYKKDKREIIHKIIEGNKMKFFVNPKALNIKQIFSKMIFPENFPNECQCPTYIEVNTNVYIYGIKSHIMTSVYPYFQTIDSSSLCQIPVTSSYQVLYCLSSRLIKYSYIHVVYYDFCLPVFLNNRFHPLIVRYL